MLHLTPVSWCFLSLWCLCGSCGESSSMEAPRAFPFTSLLPRSGGRCESSWCCGTYTTNQEQLLVAYLFHVLSWIGFEVIFWPIFNHLAQAPLSTEASSLSKTKNSCFTAESSPAGQLEMTKSKSHCRQMTAAENWLWELLKDGSRKGLGDRGLGDWALGIGVGGQGCFSPCFSFHCYSPPPR